MGGEAGGVAEALRSWRAVLLDGTGLQRERRQLDAIWAESGAKLALYSWELSLFIQVILTSPGSKLEVQIKHLWRQHFLMNGFNNAGLT